ncbi:hypothetical protein NL676_028134 [Syzygium grande]|nr:hypothetical protein NL676_028134 [Syzygium grande]
MNCERGETEAADDLSDGETVKWDERRRRRRRRRALDGWLEGGDALLREIHSRIIISSIKGRGPGPAHGL